MPEVIAGLSPITVAIPTYRRERVLTETLQYLLALHSPPAEILVLDQTERHEPATDQRLADLHASGVIRWVRLAEPSIPKAMNQGLLLATQDIVLFVDDDIRPEPALLLAHLVAHEGQGDVLVAGRVIQPWQEGVDFSGDSTVHLAGCTVGEIGEFIGCNFSVKRDRALLLGGFDENFVKVAYRYEAEFAHRFRTTGGRIWFEPAACLHHLKDAGGGTRTYGSHLTTWRPDHAVGAYYFSLRTGAVGEMLGRPLRAVITRHHLRHPMQIFGTLLAELRGLLWAWRLHRSGPRLVRGVEGKLGT